MNILFLAIKNTFNKLRGGRKQGRSRLDEIHNPRNDFIGFNNPPLPGRKVCIFRTIRFIKVIVIASIATLCAITFIDYYYGADVFKLVSSSKAYRRVGSFFDEQKPADKSANSTIDRHVDRSTHEGGSNNQRKFSQADIEKAKEQVLREKNRQYWTPDEIDKIIGPKMYSKENSDNGGKSPYYYEIELVSGVTLTSADISLQDGVIEIIDRGGLVVTLKRNELRSIKRLKAAP